MSSFWQLALISRELDRRSSSVDDCVCWPKVESSKSLLFGPMFMIEVSNFAVEIARQFGIERELTERNNVEYSNGSECEPLSPNAQSCDAHGFTS